MDAALGTDVEAVAAGGAVLLVGPRAHVALALALAAAIALVRLAHLEGREAPHDVEQRACGAGEAAPGSGDDKGKGKGTEHESRPGESEFWHVFY